MYLLLIRKVMVVVHAVQLLMNLFVWYYVDEVFCGKIMNQGVSLSASVFYGLNIVVGKLMRSLVTPSPSAECAE